MRVLIVGQDSGINYQILEVLRELGELDIQCLLDPKDLRVHLTNFPPQLLIVNADQHLTLFHDIAALNPNIPIFCLIPKSSEPLLDKLLAIQPLNIIYKPLETSQLRAALRVTLNRIYNP